MIVLFVTSRERDEGSPLPEPPLLIQKMSGIEGKGRLPLVLVKQRWGQISDDSSSLVVTIITVAVAIITVALCHQAAGDTRLTHVWGKDLGDGVSFQLDVSPGGMEQAERDHVAPPQRLVDDRVGVRHVNAIIHGRPPGLSYHLVYLSLDLLCTWKSQFSSNGVKMMPQMT